MINKIFSSLFVFISLLGLSQNTLAADVQFSIEKRYTGSIIGINNNAGGIACGVGAYGKDADGNYSDDNDCNNGFPIGTILEFQSKPLEGYAFDQYRLTGTSCNLSDATENGDKLLLTLKDNCHLEPLFAPTTNKVKACSEQQQEDPYECKKEKEHFYVLEDIIIHSEFVGLSNGSHTTKVVLIKNGIINDTTKYLDEYEFTWENDGWYRVWTPTPFLLGGEWKAEVYLDGNKLDEVTFTVTEITRLVGSSATPKIIKSGDLISFTSFLVTDHNTNKIIGSQLRYRKKGTSSWVTLDMENVSGQDYKKDTTVIGEPGEYETEIRGEIAKISDATNTSYADWFVAESFSIEEPETPINGQCGTAHNKAYPYTTTGYSPDTQCSTGTESSTIFPSAGSSTSWDCEGSNGGSTASCSASRESAPITEICGSAHNKQYPASSTSFGNDTLCINGSEPKFVFIDFPEKGGSTEWICLGVNGGDDKTCSASRASDPVAVINGQCGTANNKTYPSTAVGYSPDTQCSTGTESNTIFPGVGASTSWMCRGSNGGTSASCSASRESTPVEEQEPQISLVSGIDFGSSTSRSLNVTNNATISVYVENADTLQVNFDDIGEPEKSLTITSDGTYPVTHLFNKSLYPTSDYSNFWGKNLSYSITAYKNGVPSNVIVSDEFTIYDFTEWSAYKEEVEEKRRILEEQIAELEKLKADKEKEEDRLTNEKDSIEDTIQEKAENYTDTLKSDINEFLVNYDQYNTDCAWIEKDGSCLNTYLDPNLDLTSSEYGFKRLSVSDKYNYTIFVKYAINKKAGIKFYPADIWIHSDDPEFEFTSEPLVSKNPYQLRIQANLLIENLKNRIDFYYSGKISEIQNQIIDKDIESSGDITLLENIDDRINNAITTAVELWAEEIGTTADKLDDNFTVILDSNSSAEVGEETSRSIYQVSLGTLKATYSFIGGLVYGAAEEEINEAADEINKIYIQIKDLSEEEFLKLDEDAQFFIRETIQESINIINQTPEFRDYVVTIFYGIGEGRTNAVSTSASKGVVKIASTTSKTSVSTFKSLLKNNKIAKIVPIKSGRLVAKDITSAVSTKLKHELGDKIDDIVKHGDNGRVGDYKSGGRSEEVSEQFFKESLPDYQWVDGTYNSGVNGFDGVLVKGDEIIIYDSKQFHSGVQLTKDKNTGVIQMSDDWIDKVANKLIDTHEPEKIILGEKIIKLLDEKPENIRRFATFIDKSNKTFNVAELGIF